MSSGEIITLQCGHFANYVGSHFWNSQEFFNESSDGSSNSSSEISYQKFFRGGVNLMGEETFTPRLLLMDLKGSLNSLKITGSLYEIPTSTSPSKTVPWAGILQQYEQPSCQKNEFLERLDTEEEFPYLENTCDDALNDSASLSNPVVDTLVCQSSLSNSTFHLDGDVHVWSDFLRLHLHPKTVHIINDYCHASDFEPFDFHCFGQNVLRNRDFFQSLENNLHYFAEECDHLQGFQCFVDSADGFGGIAVDFLEGISDEYSGKSITVFGLHDVDPFTVANCGNVSALSDKYLLNSALTMNRLQEFCNIYVPIYQSSASSWRVIQTGSSATSGGAFPSLQQSSSDPLVYNPCLRYHTSAILAASLDTVTLPWRLAGDRCYTMSSTAGHLSAGASSKKIASLSSHFPLPLPEKNDPLVVKNENSREHLLNSFRSFTPLVPSIESSKISHQDHVRRWICCRGAIPHDRFCPASLQPSDLFVACHQRFPTYSPFPLIFSNDYVLGTSPTNSHSEKPSSVSPIDYIGVESSLESGQDLGKSLINLSEEVKACLPRIRKYFHFFDSGHLTSDEFKELPENIMTLSESYNPNQQ